MQPDDWPLSREQCDWFYRRSGMVMRSPFMLSSGWWEPGVRENYPAASFVAEAAKDFGFTGDEIRLALSHAAEREGAKVGRIELAVEVATKAGGGKLDAKKLRVAAESDAVRARVETSTKEFFAHQINQRPAFVVTDSIGDKAVFSGLARIEPLDKAGAYAAQDDSPESVVEAIEGSHTNVIGLPMETLGRVLGKFLP